MNRLQKKCVIGTAGIHLLLLLILIVGPAFFNRQPKNEDTTVLDVIPANLVDAAINSGVQNAQPPPPTPPTPITPQDLRPPPPIQPPPKAVEPPPTPALTPTPSLLEKFEKMFAPKPPPPTVTPDLKPVEKPAKQHQDNIQVNLNKVNRTDVKNSTHAQPDNSQNRRVLNNVLKNLSHSLSSSTKIDMPGNATAAYANYATVVRSVYEQALRPNIPDQVANNSEYTKVTITVANDGTVLSAHIISPSGDSAWDNAVQRTLDQVPTIAPFPDGATEKERNYTLSFNPEVEKSF